MSRKVVAELELRFGSDEALGVREGQACGDAVSVFADGSHAVICTNNAVQVWRALPERTRLWGFAADENPNCRVARDLDTGHDFAVVDDRYLVDPWIKLVEGALDRAVFDMKNRADARLVREWYGSRKWWGCMQRIVEQRRT